MLKVENLIFKTTVDSKITDQWFWKFTAICLQQNPRLNIEYDDFDRKYPSLFEKSR